MKYRQRSEENTLSILNTLRKKYKTSHFRLSDYILPNNYYSTLLPKLSDYKKEEKFIITCEIKANVTENKMKLLRDSGFIEVQPGIESFSTNVLKKMDKGVSAIQNVFCLLMGKKYGIQVNYNFLYGFPDDEYEEYKEMISTIPKLYHLNPPAGKLEVAITRFSPLQNTPEKFGIPSNLKHHPGYDVIFSDKFLSNHDFSLKNFSYYFEKEYNPSKSLQRAYNVILNQLKYWEYISQNRVVDLLYETKDDKIIFYDNRYNEEFEEIEMDYEYSLIYCAIDNSITKIFSLKKKFNTIISNSKIDQILHELNSRHLILKDKDSVIGLALNEVNKHDFFYKSTSERFSKSKALA